MPRYTTSQTYTDGNTQIVALPEQNQVQGTGNQIVEYRGDGAVADRKDDEDLEEKLRRISEQVPVRISNTSGSSAGSGSGDFHQVFLLNCTHVHEVTKDPSPLRRDMGTSLTFNILSDSIYLLTSLSCLCF